eukprot:CAMPEP_0194077478 /NCGR_PEP_ID=MMETSP0149-20130528/4092_1 /TAXON_ID=122233 /ORGANISM="Chaetoceros debilis, Strain MM31A-1" /LENGTH=492 /DNA_ID=CAMNT_0038758515 /DNA_START=372 /DNA_END=1850 /DNA_ORIENTATION=+
MYMPVKEQLHVLKRYYTSDSTSGSSPSSSSPSSSEHQYAVARISKGGSVSETDMSISELLRSSSMHARDLFALALTSKQEQQLERNIATAKSRSSSSSQNSSTSTNKGLISRYRKNKRSPAAILPRLNEIIVSFGNARAVITPHSGVLFNAHKPSVKLLAQSLASSFIIHANYNQKSTEGAFELIFLEEILKDVVTTYNRRLILYEPIVDTVVTKVSNEMSAASGVHRLVPVKDSLLEFEIQVESALNCLTHLLGNEEDMLGLLLTERQAARDRGEEMDIRRHEDVELLLEEYARQLSYILAETNYLLKKVQSKQELVAISLDAYRNRMLRMNLYLSIAGVGIGSATAAAGYFGMNLVSGLEDHPAAFGSVVTGTTLFALLFGVGCVSYISGSAAQSRTLSRLRELVVLEGALNNLNALDFVLKRLVEERTTEQVSKDSFQQRMMDSGEITGGVMTAEEIDLLFDSMDMSQNGTLEADDFRSLEDVGRHTRF